MIPNVAHTPKSHNNLAGQGLPLVFKIDFDWTGLQTELLAGGNLEDAVPYEKLPMQDSKSTNIHWSISDVSEVKPAKALW